MVAARADGTVVSNRGFQSSDSFDFGNPELDLVAGNYQLNVSGSGATTGAYSFRLLDFAAATPLTPGTPVSSTLNPGTETDNYSFNVATPNSKFYFDVTTSIGNATWKLLDPQGNMLFDSGFGSDVDTLNLANPGVYTLVIEGRRNGGQFGAVCVQGCTRHHHSTALTLGATVNGASAFPAKAIIIPLTWLCRCGWRSTSWAILRA